MTTRGSSLFAPVALSIAVVPIVPVVLVLVLLSIHAASYAGVCGPYPTDIPAHACGFEEYLVNFFEPFAMAGLLVISIASMVATTALVALAWALAGLGGLVARALRPST